MDEKRQATSSGRRTVVSVRTAARRVAIGCAITTGILLGLTGGNGSEIAAAAPPDLSLRQQVEQERPFVSEPVEPVVLEIDLRDLPRAKPAAPNDPVGEAPGQELPGEEIGAPAGDTTRSGTTRPLRTPIRRPSLRQGHSLSSSMNAFSSPVVSVDGIPASLVPQFGFVPRPPDTNGDVGPNHYMQAVNSLFAVFDKNGNVLAGPSFLNAMWVAAADAGLVGPNDPCVLNNDGDPVVLYDHLADRWLLSQFVAFSNQCIAISQTADPVAGGWFLYNFPSGVVNDYPKFGVWPDAYYMGTNSGYPGGHAWAFDRASMLNGTAATFQRFPAAGTLPTFMLPSDLDGPPPPAGAPNVFLRFVDGAEFGGVDRLEFREFHVDFGNPALSTFTLLADLPTAPFDSNLCGFGMRPQCVPQPGTTQVLDTLRGQPMYRLQYRNFGTHEALVVNHTVDVDGADLAGIRWYELRKIGAAWSIFQQGTYSPDPTHRWMGSIAMDKVGNAALGYSVSSATVFPGIRYAGRLATDALGVLPQGEFTLVAGGSAQTGSAGRRWGDYSAMAVDPVDGCTFWFTTEYYSASSPNWLTRIGAFRVPECPLPVLIDIKPGSFPNSINLKNRGVIPVAILSTAEFDATTVNPSTVCFGDADAPAQRDCTEAHGKGHLQDVNADGRLDMVLHYETRETGIDAGDTEACLTGATIDGQAIEGCDSVRTL
jgi:hypothetical protein